MHLKKEFPIKCFLINTLKIPLEQGVISHEDENTDASPLTNLLNQIFPKITNQVESSEDNLTQRALESNPAKLESGEVDNGHY